MNYDVKILKFDFDKSRIFFVNINFSINKESILNLFNNYFVNLYIFNNRKQLLNKKYIKKIQNVK